MAVELVNMSRKISRSFPLNSPPRDGKNGCTDQVPVMSTKTGRNEPDDLPRAREVFFANLLGNGMILLILKAFCRLKG
jgi:hypothetical protein